MKKKWTWVGFWSLFGSMFIYAFSGLIVVGLAEYFGNIAQVTWRGLAATMCVLGWMFVGKSSFKLSKNYPEKWLWVDVLCRPVSQIAFVYSVLTVNPTVALFYLFAAKVIGGFILDLVIDRQRYRSWWDLGSLLIVIVGLYIFSYPINDSWSLGVWLAIVTGLLEAVKSKAMEKIKVDSEDRLVLVVMEFVGLVLITSVVLLVLGQEIISFTTTPWLWLILFLAGLTSVGALVLELKGFRELDGDLGNVILASEIGFAGLINFLVLGVHMTHFQIIGAGLLTLSLYLVGKAASVRSKN